MSASLLRARIETALANRIPSALTPQLRIRREVISSGIDPLDRILGGGFPIGALTELIGPECSGRTGLALSFVAQVTREERVSAWVDVSNTLDPESAAAAGLDLERLLWIRCGVASGSESLQNSESAFRIPDKYFVPPQIKKGLHGGGFGSHPRGEVKGLSDALSSFLRSEQNGSRRVESGPRTQPDQGTSPCNASPQSKRIISSPRARPLSRIEQAIRVTDLLLQGGGFSSIVLDMSSIGPEQVSQIPMSTWFRYRAAAERTQASVLLLTQHPCAKSSACLALRLQPVIPLSEETTVLAGHEQHIEVSRQRLESARATVVTFGKQLQNARSATWKSKSAWVGVR
jgi:recombination protein RecA